MIRSSETSFLDRLLEPVGKCLTPEVAQRLVDVRATSVVQDRIDQLADKNTEGTLTADERAEYDTYVHAIEFIGALQSSARALLAAKRNS
jgi:hypothetical protein